MFARIRSSLVLLVPLALLVPLMLVPLVPLKAQRSWGGTIDLGYVDASGNTETRTFSLGQNLKWNTSPRFQLLQQLRAVYGEAGDSVNANLLDADITGDYRMFARVGVTLGVGYDRNKFAGIARRTEESVGLSWAGETGRGDSLRFVTGVVWTQQENTEDVRNDFVSARAGFTLRAPLGANAYLLQSTEALPNLETSDDWRINNETALVATLAGRLAIKLAYVIRYDNLPEPTFRDTDRLFTAGIQVTY
jgi:putative salt-induced outer membrane protein